MLTSQARTMRVVTGASASCSRSASASAIRVSARALRRRRVLGPIARERRAFRDGNDSRRLVSVSQSVRALGGDDDDDATAVSESEVYDESLAAFIARSTRVWIAQQPQNLRNVTPLLRWPNDKLFALSTLRGTLKNTLAVLLGMVLMTVFLGGADALLLAFQAKFARPLLV